MSQSLTYTQRNYSQLEKEALALIIALDRFHKFLWGRKFLLQMDCKHLVALLQTDNTKGLKPTTASSLKHWAVTLLGYDFRIKYVQTQDFGQVDGLSCLAQKFREDNIDEIHVAGVRAVKEEIQQLKKYSIDQFGTTLKKELKHSTKEDEHLNAVMEAIKNNWNVPIKSDIVDQFMKRRDNLSIVDDTLLLEDRVVIPMCLQRKILTSLHKGHPAIRQVKQLAREFVYWRKICEDIKRCVRQCDACTVTQKMPTKVPLNPWRIPIRPLERMHTNYIRPIDGQYLLIFVDAFSKFVEVFVTSGISANRLILLCYIVDKSFVVFFMCWFPLVHLWSTF